MGKFVIGVTYTVKPGLREEFMQKVHLNQPHMELIKAMKNSYEVDTHVEEHIYGTLWNQKLKYLDMLSALKSVE